MGGRFTHRMDCAARTLLAIIAGWCILTGLAYGPMIGEIPDTITPIVRFIPPLVWSSAWIVAGVLQLLGLRWYWSRRWGVTIAMGLTLLLACTYTAAWLAGDMARGWVSAKNYVLIAGVVAYGGAVLIEGVMTDADSRRSHRPR